MLIFFVYPHLQIRLYPRVTNLDNAFAFILKVPFPVLLLNVFKDYLITFCSDCHISIFKMERRDSAASEYLDSLACLTGVFNASSYPNGSGDSRSGVKGHVDTGMIHSVVLRAYAGIHAVEVMLTHFLNRLPGIRRCWLTHRLKFYHFPCFPLEKTTFSTNNIEDCFWLMHCLM